MVEFKIIKDYYGGSKTTEKTRAILVEIGNNKFVLTASDKDELVVQKSNDSINIKPLVANHIKLS